MEVSASLASRCSVVEERAVSGQLAGRFSAALRRRELGRVGRQAMELDAVPVRLTSLGVKRSPPKTSATGRSRRRGFPPTRTRARASGNARSLSIGRTGTPTEGSVRRCIIDGHGFLDETQAAGSPTFVTRSPVRRLTSVPPSVLHYRDRPAPCSSRGASHRRWARLP